MHQYGQMPRTQEYQRTATIRNQVNLKKQTLKLERVEGAPSSLAIHFTFDASAACRVLTFVNAREDSKCKITCQRPANRPAVSYGKGLEQKFPPADAAAAAAHAVDAGELASTSRPLPPPGQQLPKDTVYPLVVRMEALTDEGRAQGKVLEEVAPGGELPPWVQSQTTYAWVERDGEEWVARVVKQKIWVKGEAYELQEIYGMEQNSRGPAMGLPASVEGFEDVEGNECVICMSAPRDTAALPCRHMCMCHGCASALKTQTNKCPICRNEITSLLHIKINKGTPAPAAQPQAAS